MCSSSLPAASCAIEGQAKMNAAALLPSLNLRFVAIWRRNFLVWRKLAIPSVLGNPADPKDAGLWGI